MSSVRRRGRQQNIDELLNQEYLDESEQEKLVQELEALHAEQARVWLSTLGIVTFVFASFFANATWRQYVEPWGEKYTGELRTVVSSQAALFLLSLQTCSLAATAYGLLKPIAAREDLKSPASRQQRSAMLLGAVGSCAAAVGWSYFMWCNVSKWGWQLGMHWSLFWLPLAPPICCLLGQHTANSIRATGAQVAELGAMRYNFKKA